MSENTFCEGESKQDFLFGVLALQAEYIDVPTLVDAVDTWVTQGSRPLSRILRDQDKLTVAQRVMIEALVQERLGTKHSAAANGHSDKGNMAPPSHASTASAGGGAQLSSSLRGRCMDHSRYRVLRPHAKGGLGEIFVAEDQELDREVALKEIQPNHANEPSFRARFVREAKITGGLEHPGIVPIYSLGAHADGRPYYAMRFVNGVNLKEAIDRFHQADVAARDRSERALEFRQLLRRFVDMCNAVAYAHSRGVLHRDLKPGNVMLGQFGETLIVDWGLAKRLEENSEFRIQNSESESTNDVIDTQPGAALGTPAYMSPEQAAGQVDLLGPAADVYGLGATLYTVLTGRPPFGSADRGGLLRAVQMGEFPRPRQIKNEVSAALEAICLRAMALQPTDRYGSALDLAGDVEHWLADEPVAAHREPWHERSRRFLRKHRTLATSAAAMLIVAALLSSGAAVLLNVARAGERHARFDQEQQKEAAQLAEQTAKQAKDKAEAVAQFLVDAFRTPDPKRNGPDVKVVEILDWAVLSLDKKFANDPATRGRLLDALGETFKDLGLAKRAIELLKPSRELLGESLGRDHVETLVASTHLALAYRDAGRHAEALRETEEIHELYKGKLGPNHRTTIGSLGNVGHARMDVGRVNDAIPILEEVVRRLPKFDTDSDASGIVGYMASLATAYHEIGRYTEALALFEDAVRWRKVNLGPEHFNTLRAMGSVAWTYHDMGRVADAVALFEETVSGYRAKFGSDYPATLALSTGLATSCLSHGKPSEALSILEASVPQLTAKVGPDHPFTLAAVTTLATAYREVGRHADALRLMVESLPQTRARHGMDHPRTLRAMTILAGLYRDTGRLQEALALFDDALARTRRGLPDSPALATTLVGVGQCLMQEGKYPEAELRFQEALKIIEERQPTSWLRFSTQVLLGGALVNQQKYVEAEPLLRVGYDGLRALNKAYPSDASQSMVEAASGLAHVCEATGRLSEAAEWRGNRR